ncbi:MAG TPA: FlgD immunoglobulin-like domain containing protein, partial [Candidatus Glassbacteria bacterium]|nr:FlgD immunoglobulin-like domain containing protein [Candidatus Glassbacteria bacterium]
SILLPLLVSTAFAQTKPEVTVTDASIVGNVTWSSDTIYVLSGFVFVGDGETLTIPAGTVVKGMPGQGVSASALVVARGGKIYANGTAGAPVIFTAQSDDVEDAADMPLDSRGLWGGVILLGRAETNTADSTGHIEGIPTTEPRGTYGGSLDTDNSGVMRYVSIRHGGTNIGEGNEINGLTFGAVGSGTTIEHIEVFNNQDDGYEWFGGTVNTKYLVSAFNGDDSFDYDEGFRGKGQFWFAVMSDQSGIGNLGAEQDGGTVPEDGLPLAIPVLYNATYIGSGAAPGNTENDLALIFRDNAGGKYYNSVFTDFSNYTLQVEDLTSGEDSRARLEAGDLVLNNNIWYGFGAGTTWPTMVETAYAFVETYMADPANKNTIEDPLLRGISRTTDEGLDPRPKSVSPVFQDVATVPNDGFFTEVSYRGAFGTTNWLTGWTFLSAAGFLGDLADSTGAPTTGDLNGDSEVDISDVVRVIDFALGKQTPTASQLSLADLNADGVIDIFDVLKVLSIALGNSGSMLASSRDRIMNLSNVDEITAALKSLGADNSVVTDVELLIARKSGGRINLPKAFGLSQNYPNPFNPTTTISYAIPEGQTPWVSLKIYDVRGSLVRVLVDGQELPGAHVVMWDGKNESGGYVASGTYFYRLKAGEYVSARKMVLLK